MRTIVPSWFTDLWKPCRVVNKLSGANVVPKPDVFGNKFHLTFTWHRLKFWLCRDDEDDSMLTLTAKFAKFPKAAIKRSLGSVR